MTSAAFSTALGSHVTRIGVFLRLSVDPVFRMWSGVGQCRAGIDATDGSGEIYHGLGEIVNLPAFQQLINGAADRVEFSMSNVSQRVAQMASVESADVKGSVLRLGIGIFDANWQLIEQPIWLRRFVVDFLSVARDQSQATAVWTLSLHARSLLTGRRRSPMSFFTDRDQQARHPGDKFCENVATYSQDVMKIWPRFPPS